MSTADYWCRCAKCLGISWFLFVLFLLPGCTTVQVHTLRHTYTLDIKDFDQCLVNPWTEAPGVNACPLSGIVPPANVFTYTPPQNLQEHVNKIEAQDKLAIIKFLAREKAYLALANNRFAQRLDQVANELQNSTSDPVIRVGFPLSDANDFFRTLYETIDMEDMDENEDKQVKEFVEKLNYETAKEHRVRRLYIKNYLKAYFSNGKVFEFKVSQSALEDKLKEEFAANIRGCPKITVSPSQAQGNAQSANDSGSGQKAVSGSSVSKDLKNTFCNEVTSQGDAEIDKLVKRELDRFPKARDTNGNEIADQVVLYGKVSDDGFIARNGATYKFPSLVATLDLTANKKISINQVNFSAVATDLLRVFIEAVFDSRDRLPAISNATGRASEFKTDSGDYRLPAFVPGGKIDVNGFQHLNAMATQVEAVTGASVSQVIRGGSLVALNNEALAQLVETAISSIAKKSTEKLLWCFAVCKPDPQPSNE